jgi:hypothetical protein
VQLDLQDLREQQDLLERVEERRVQLVQLVQLEQWVRQEHLVRREVSAQVDPQELREQLV